MRPDVAPVIESLRGARAVRCVHWRAGSSACLARSSLSCSSTKLWLFGWVLWWSRFNPEGTRFMQIRLASRCGRATRRRRLDQRWVDYGRVSNNLKRALIVSEDDLFVHHEGFDWEGIQKAIEKNSRRGKVVAGGSGGLDLAAGSPRTSS